MKPPLLLFFLFSILFINKLIAQHHSNNKYAFINKESLERIKGEQPELESLGYQVYNGDTIIKIEKKFLDQYNSNRVKVPYEFKDSIFLDIYKNVVYRTHFTPKNENKWKMKLWKDTLKIYFNKSVPKSHKESLMRLANKVSKKIDSLNIIQVNDINQSNYLIYYLDENQNFNYELAIDNEKAGYYVRWDGPFIYQGRLKINTLTTHSHLEDMVLLKYYFFLSLGYFSNSNQVEPKAYLSTSRKIRKLTPIDLELLKYHYSYGICKGTDLATF